MEVIGHHHELVEQELPLTAIVKQRVREQAAHAIGSKK
jgi:hypothetical protein